MDNLDEQNVGGNILEIEAKTLGGGGEGEGVCGLLVYNGLQNF